jgi:hypothetical protein
MMSSGMGSTMILRSNNFAAGMSHLSQHRTWRLRFVMSALTQQADINWRLSQVRFGPRADINGMSTVGPLRPESAIHDRGLE